jgi:hypothetical protein
MESDKTENIERQQRTLGEIATHALSGALIGLLFASIPLSFAWGSDSFQEIHIIVSLGFVAFCGILSAIWGEKFIDRLLDLFNLMPPVGSPAYMVISVAYLNNWSEAEII